MPHQEKRSIATQLSGFKAPVMNTYSLETTVAEKLDAILSLMEFSSRMKDYYDLYYLANKFDFDGAVLTEALRETFANRNRQFTAEQFEQIIAFDTDDGMQKKWKAFTKKTGIKVDDFKLVLVNINNFLREPFKVLLDGKDFKLQWYASENSWRGGEGQ